MEAQVSDSMLPLFKKTHISTRAIEDYVKSGYIREYSDEPHKRNALRQAGHLYRVVNGELYRHGTDKEYSRYGLRIVVHDDEPEKKSEILRKCHVDDLDNHCGMNITLKNLTETYYWQGMTTHVKVFMKLCPQCKTRSKMSAEEWVENERENQAKKRVDATLCKEAKEQLKSLGRVKKPTPPETFFIVSAAKKTSFTYNEDQVDLEDVNMMIDSNNIEYVVETLGHSEEGIELPEICQVLNVPEIIPMPEKFRSREIENFLKYGCFPPDYTANQKNGLRNPASQYTILDGELYHESNKTGSRGMRLVVHDDLPALKVKIMVENHLDEDGSHCGLNKTLRKISEKYYWTGLSIDMRRFMMHCKVCNSNRSKQGVHEKSIQLSELYQKQVAMLKSKHQVKMQQGPSHTETHVEEVEAIPMEGEETQVEEVTADHDYVEGGEGDGQAYNQVIRLIGPNKEVTEITVALVKPSGANADGSTGVVQGIDQETLVSQVLAAGVPLSEVNEVVEAAMAEQIPTTVTESGNDWTEVQATAGENAAVKTLTVEESEIETEPVELMDSEGHKIVIKAESDDRGEADDCTEMEDMDSMEIQEKNVNNEEGIDDQSLDGETNAREEQANEDEMSKDLVVVPLKEAQNTEEVTSADTEVKQDGRKSMAESAKCPIENCGNTFDQAGNGDDLVEVVMINENGDEEHKTMRRSELEAVSDLVTVTQENEPIEGQEMEQTSMALPQPATSGQYTYYRDIVFAPKAARTRMIEEFIREGQVKGAYFGRIVEVAQNYQLVDDVLHHRHPRYRTGQMVIHDDQPEVKLKLISKFHRKPNGAHCTAKVTASKLSYSYFWEEMRWDVHRFFIQCDGCVHNGIDVKARKPIKTVEELKQQEHDMRMNKIRSGRVAGMSRQFRERVHGRLETFKKWGKYGKAAVEHEEVVTTEEGSEVEQGMEVSGAGNGAGTEGEVVLIQYNEDFDEAGEMAEMPQDGGDEEGTPGDREQPTVIQVQVSDGTVQDVVNDNTGDGVEIHIPEDGDASQSDTIQTVTPAKDTSGHVTGAADYITVETLADGTELDTNLVMAEEAEPETSGQPRDVTVEPLTGPKRKVITLVMGRGAGVNAGARSPKGKSFVPLENVSSEGSSKVRVISVGKMSNQQSASPVKPFSPKTFQASASSPKSSNTSRMLIKSGNGKISTVSKPNLVQTTQSPSKVLVQSPTRPPFITTTKQPVPHILTSKQVPSAGVMRTQPATSTVLASGTTPVSGFTSVPETISVASSAPVSGTCDVTVPTAMASRSRSTRGSIQSFSKDEGKTSLLAQKLTQHSPVKRAPVAETKVVTKGTSSMALTPVESSRPRREIKRPRRYSPDREEDTSSPKPEVIDVGSVVSPSERRSVNHSTGLNTKMPARKSKPVETVQQSRAALVVSNQTPNAKKSKDSSTKSGPDLNIDSELTVDFNDVTKQIVDTDDRIETDDDEMIGNDDEADDDDDDDEMEENSDDDQGEGPGQDNSAALLVLANDGKEPMNIVKTDLGYMCSLCNCKFRTERLCLSHGAKNICFNKCGLCGRTYKKALSPEYMQHLMKHEQGEKHKCGQCDKVFFDKTMLSLHKRVHAEDACVPCTDCGERFYTSFHHAAHTLKVHKKTPTLFNCDVCQAQFVNISLMRSEIMFDGEISCFKCVMCPQ